MAAWTGYIPSVTQPTSRINPMAGLRGLDGDGAVDTSPSQESDSPADDQPDSGGSGGQSGADPNNQPALGSPLGGDETSLDLQSQQGKDANVAIPARHDPTTGAGSPGDDAPLKLWDGSDLGNPAQYPWQSTGAATDATTDAGLSKLIQAMAAYHADNPGYNASPISQGADYPELHAALAANWH